MRLTVVCLFLMCTRVAEVLAGLGASNAAFYGAPTTANSAHATEMQNAWLTDADAARLAAALPALRVLSLRAVVASEKSLSSVLFSALTSPTLQTLCLRHVRMCSKVLTAAVKRLEEVTPSASEGVSDAAAAAVDSGVGGAPAAPAAAAAAAATAAAVGHVNVHLRTLDLSFNHYEEGAVRPLVALLRRCTGLTALHLDGNKMTADGIARLAACIRRHPSLRQVSLSGCAVDDESVDSVARAVKDNRNLTDLDLSQNSFSAEGFAVLTETFRSGAGKHIEGLDLSYTPLGDSGVAHLARALQTNQLPALRRLVLKEVGAGPQALQRLLAAVQEGSALETLDVSGNALFPGHKGKDKKGSGYSPKDLKKKLLQMTGELTPQISGAVKSLSSTLSSHLQSASELLEAKTTELLALTQTADKPGRKGKGKGKGKGKSAGKGKGKSAGKSQSQSQSQGDNSSSSRAKGKKAAGKDSRRARGRAGSEGDDEAATDADRVTAGLKPTPKAAAKTTAKAAKGKAAGAKKETGADGSGKGVGPAPASVYFQESVDGATQRLRSKTLAALLRACRRAPRLRVLGLAKVGLTDASATLMERVAQKMAEKEAQQAAQKPDADATAGPSKGVTEAEAGVPPPLTSLPAPLTDATDTDSDVPDAPADALYRSLPRSDPVAAAEAALARERARRPLLVRLEVNDGLSPKAAQTVRDVLQLP